jgi:hypothetical protein
MWTLYDMASGEIIATSPEPQGRVARPLPLYAPGAATCVCPMTVAAVPTARPLRREVVLPPGAEPGWVAD